MSQPNTQRFLALDVFRGMTVCFMIIVNTPGNYETTFAPLLHANWHGFTPTDLVFPSFLFAVGNALSFVMNKWSGMSQREVLTKILKRTFIIFLLGFLMYWFPFVKWENGELVAAPISDTRIFGVLQRIGLCYGIAALMFYYLKPKWTYILSGLLLFAYWGMLYAWGDAADPLSLQGNAVLSLDRALIGERHMYHGEGIAFDPEGLLSTIPAIANVTLGFWAGSFIQRKGKTWETLGLLLLTGAFLMFLAYCWNPYFPINKKLWTGSFVLLTVGLDCVILATIIYIIDFRHQTRWTYFFEVFGKNPLFIYLLSEIIAMLLWFFKTSDGTAWYTALYQNVFSHFGDYLGSFLFALTVMLTCWLVGWFMDRKRIYVRV
ncbi:DUF5009 domain-containing protein [Flavihumibacter rivuli]|uniref:acyltransferase family protein n=1 Tax=Flavihumibacter rivuli TaxID=2838156 RepID=UPI001BDDE4D4|nr:DUF5009 domain-containing protein [Flavihumibacter rivuli]ULQ55398.1 DUF5009 domain-containing protein [Flavihumibacter rivuli]